MHKGEPEPRSDDLPEGSPAQASRIPLADTVERLFGKYRAALLRYIRERVFNPADAEDIVQDVYYRLARRRELESLEYPQAYLFQIAGNLLKDMKRYGSRHRIADHIDLALCSEELEDPANCPEQQAQAAQTLYRISTALSELKPRCRAVFLLHRLRGKSYKQIAHRLDIAVSTVEKDMSRALEHIFRRLAEPTPVARPMSSESSADHRAAQPGSKTDHSRARAPVTDANKEDR